MAKEAKTNAMRMLDRQKVKYEAFPYECDEFIDGLHSSINLRINVDFPVRTGPTTPMYMSPPVRA